MPNAGSNTREDENTTSTINADQAITLFQFYESKGFQDKQQMISLISWLTPVVFGLIAFCWQRMLSQSSSSLIVVLSALVAALLSGYARFIVREFITHAEENYDRAWRVRELKQLSDDVKGLLFLNRSYNFMKSRKKLGSVEVVGPVFLTLFHGSRIVFSVSIGTFVLAIITPFCSSRHAIISSLQMGLL